MQHDDLRNHDPGDLGRWLVQASPDGLWVFDAQGMTVFANDRLAQLLKRTSAQMVRLSVFDCMDEQGKQDLSGHLAQLATTRIPGSNLECRFLCGDGSDIWALVSHTPIHDDHGDHVGWLHRVTEYSEQRKLLDAHQHRGQQLAEAQRIARIGSWEWDVQQDRVTWSDELYRIYHVDRGTVLVPDYQSFLDRLHPDDRDRVRALVGAALGGTDAFEFDARAMQPDGSIMWIRGRGQVTRNAMGEVTRVGGTSQDITATKDAELSLALLSAMATTANQASRLVDVVPTILSDVVTHTGWRPVAAWLVDEQGTLRPVDVPLRPVPQQDRVEVLRLTDEAVRDRQPTLSRTTRGTTLVAAPIVAEGRATSVLILDTRTQAPPSDSDWATVNQASALFARVAERELARERLAAARDDAMAASVAKSQFLA
ncbi:MAG: PAS domain-containing protein, partial [Pedococcus sp.]